MGSKGGGNSQRVSDTQQVNQTSTPWSAQIPHLQNAFGEAQQLYNTGGQQYFPGSTVTPFSTQTQQGIDQLGQRALGGSMVSQGAQGLASDALNSRPQFAGAQSYLPDPAQNTLQQTAAGQNLTGNPYLDQQFDHAASRVTDAFNRNVTPQIAAQFSQAGRTGSNAHAGAIGQASGRVSDSLAGLANQIYGGNYQRERDRQLGAAGQLGSQGLQAGGLDAGVYGAQLQQQSNLAGLSNQLANQDYTDIYQLLGAGGLVEGQDQRVLQDQINRHNFAQTQPYDNLARYLAAIQGNYGGTATSQGTNTLAERDPNRFQNALGGAGLGYQLGGPMGALAGGVLGILS